MGNKLFFQLCSMMILTAFCLFGSCVSDNSDSYKGDMIVWHDKPGVAWLDAMPVGNGMLAGMVFGNVKEERIALNESSFWSGRPHNYDDPNAGQHFEYIKEQVFAGKFLEMEKFIDKNFYGIPVAQQAYQPLGDLLFYFPAVDTTDITNYRRELDMEKGLSSVTYKSGDVSYKREVFVSYPDKVMVVRITADKPKSLTMQAELKSHFTKDITANPNRLVLDGQWRKPDVEGNSWNWLIAEVDDLGMNYQTVLSAIPEGGTSDIADNRINISGADAVTFVLSAATAYVKYDDISADPAERVREVLANVEGKDYKALYKAHTDDFQKIMGRVHLTVGDPAMNEKPIDQRLAAMQGGTKDANLEALVFQFGRYALVSSSRAGGQAANLQGIWNQAVLPPWGSKYTININIQMNYWPTEVTNLSECGQPLFDMVEDLSETGAKTAKTYYGIDKGWVTHHNTDLWRGAAPVDGARFGMWPVGGAWLTLHLCEHYAYNQDIEFLKKYYPVIKGSAEFLYNLLCEHPQLGYLVTPFSMSPEHGFIYDGDKLGYVSPAPTMDVAILRELFPYVIEYSEILDVDADFRAQLKDALGKLPPYKVNSNGFVQEWIEDWGSGAQGHNFSANFPFFPGKSILTHRESDKDLVKATNNWMDTRIARAGFPASWDICMWSRLERGDKVGEFISFGAARVANNLHRDGPNNQIDATFGFTAGVAESLIQSHEAEIVLLPALSSHWPNGSVTGLRARGGYEVDMVWENGKLTSAEISNPRGGECTVRNGGQRVNVKLEPGKKQVLSFSIN